MNVTLNTTRCILILLISFFPLSTYADTYYGVLRGSEFLTFKSPYSGFITLNSLKEGDIGKDAKLFTIHNYEYENKKKILSLKIKNAEKQKTRIQREYQDGLSAFYKGFVSQRDLYSYEDKLDNIELYLTSLRSEINSLNDTLQLGDISINKPFIMRSVNVNNQQYVNPGDLLMNVELLDRFYVDIKIDPVVFPGNIKEKNIGYSSLVANITGKASVIRISGIVDHTNSKASGMRMVTLLLDGDRSSLQALLDTAFEIKIDD